MDPEGVVILEMDERISMRRIEAQTFQMKIHQVTLTDSGQYHCLVQEWIQDPDGIWYNLDRKSVAMELNVFAKGMLVTNITLLLAHITNYMLHATTCLWSRKAV